MTTKLNDKQICLICVVLAVAAFLIVYFVPFANLKDEVSSLESENRTVREHVESLQVYHDNRAQYESDTEVLKKEISNILAQYPAGYRTEDYIMEAVSVEENVSLEYSSISISDATSLALIDEETVKTANIEDYQSQIEFLRQNVTYTNKLDYYNLKEAIGELFGSKNQSNIQSITYTCNEDDGELSGTIVVGYYYVTGTGKEYTAPSIPAYESGTSNIFGSFAASQAVGESETASGSTGVETGKAIAVPAGNADTATDAVATDSSAADTSSQTDTATSTTGTNTGTNTSTNTSTGTSTSGGFFSEYGT